MELSERNIRQLEDEGFESVYEVFDEPNEIYPPHTHNTKHVIIISEGSMEVIMDNESKTYTSGDRIDIPVGVSHRVVIGSKGCKYVIGE